MNKKTRYEIRLSVQLKNEFISCGGNANIVRTLIDDYIVRTNNNIMANENPNAIWNLSVHDSNVRTDNKKLYTIRNGQIFPETTLEVTKKDGTEFKSGGFKKIYHKGEPLRKKYSGSEYIIKEALFQFCGDELQTE